MKIKSLDVSDTQRDRECATEIEKKRKFKI